MVFILRVRGRGGTKRLMFADSPTPTYQALQLQIADLFGVKPEQQKLSRKPLHAPEWVVAKPTDTLTALKLNHGDELYLSGEDASSTSSSSSSSSSSAPTSTPTTSSTSSSLSRPTSAASTAKLTSRCNHGPRGRCPHCDGPQPGATPKGKCNHGPGATCMHCSEHVNDTKAEPAAWLCNHPDNVFCPKCIPPENDDEKYKNRVLPCTCDKKHGQSCIRCADKGPVIKVDKIPYSRFMDERKALCKYKHGPQTTCAFCADPALPSFTGKKNCDKGHRPWPHGVCLSCAPANATLREQGYRHCDSISVETKIIENFYKNWMRRGSHLQRAAILFGKYVDEPEETKNPGAIRAEVYALYEPPQENQPTGVRFLRDPQEKIVHDVAARLGLEPVGWVITTLERKEDQKYGGKILASAAEVQQAARFQNRYKNNVGHSRFVTIIIEHANEVVPRAYQVSDLAVAMERDGVFGQASDPYMMATRIPAKGEMTPTVVYKDKPLLPGDEFLPDELIVKVILTTPKNPHSLLKHHDFPSVGTDAAVRSHMSQYGREEYASKLADFNLLIYLASKLSNPEIVNQVADAIRQRQPLPAPLKAQLDQALIEKQLI